LDTAALALDHLDVDEHGVAWLEVGILLAGGELRHLFFVELLQQVHGKFSIGGAGFRAQLTRQNTRQKPKFSGSGELLRQSADFVTHHKTLCFRAFQRGRKTIYVIACNRCRAGGVRCPKS
jgi:hypothetical protein